MNRGCRSILLRGLLPLAVVALPVCLFGWGALYALENFKGVCQENSFTLSPEDLERVSELGYDPEIVTAAAAAQGWCNGRFGKNVDIGILMAIYLAETVHGTTYGGYDFSPVSDSPAGWLLDRFEQFDIRSKNPVAAKYVRADYSGYRGHKAGEMGPGFWPPTGKSICQKYLQDTSCDYWDPVIFMRGEAAVIAACGYNSSSSNESKFEALWCWNHDSGYRRRLLEWADWINSEIGFFTPIPVVSGSSAPSLLQWGLGPENDLGVFAFLTLQNTGFFPHAEEAWLDAPFPPEYPRNVTQGWRVKDGTDSQGHTGIDWDCESGDPIVAVASGEVIRPRFGSLMWWLSDYYLSGSFGFGKTVWIEHPNGLYTSVHHMDSVLVSKGDKVARGQQIGTCGTTGVSTGTHAHLEVSDQHPDEFWIYHEWGKPFGNGGYVDPNLYLGHCGEVRAN